MKSFAKALHESLQFNQKGILCVDGIPYNQIKSKANSTEVSSPPPLNASDQAQYNQGLYTSPGPFYCYSLPKVTTQYKKVHKAYESRLKSFSLHYSMKANSTAAVVKHLVDLGAGIDCVSGGEVFRALAAGCPADKIVFAGVGKTLSDIRYSVANGIKWFDVENVLEVDHIARAARECGLAEETTPKEKRVNIALRVNPDVEADTHPRIATGHGGAKFGLPLDIVKKVLETKPTEHKHLNFTGLHLHIGSQLGSVSKTVDAITVTKEFLKEFMPSNRNRSGNASSAGAVTSTVISHINVGGGLPANYGTQADGEELPTADAFGEAVCPLVQEFEHVMLEPGRSIIGEAGVLFTEVLYRKEQDGQKMLIVDASMCDLMRPALYNAHHPIGPCEVEPAMVAPPGEDSKDFGQRAVDSWQKFTIVGPVCESTDVLATNIVLPESAAQPGAMLAILTAGAYGASMQSTYNSRPVIPEVVTVIANGDANGSGAAELKLVKKRQNWAELIAQEDPTQE